MSDYFCPSCDTPLSSEHINISEGVAMCPNCGKLSRLSEVIEYDRPTAEIINEPPPGCSLANQINTTVIRVSLRSFGGFLGSLFMCLFWNGITGVFVIIALAGIYSNLIGPLPEWAPAPTMEGEDGPMSLGMSIFLCIFLIPFVTVGLVMLSVMLLSAMGALVVRVGQDTATVKTGIGPIGYTRRFDPRRVRSVNTGKTKWKSNDESKPLIQIDADRTVRFATGLEEAKRDWLIAVLRQLLIDSDH